MGKDLQGARALLALAQFLCGASRKLAHGLDQGRQRSDRISKAAGAGNLLFGSRRLLQADAAHALQFTHRALEYHAPFVPGLDGGYGQCWL